jgi:hypothetical protein
VLMWMPEAVYMFDRVRGVCLTGCCVAAGVP